MNIEELENLLTTAKKVGRVNPREKHLWKEASLTFLNENFKGEHCSKCLINLIKKLTNYLTKYKKDEELKKTISGIENVESVENVEELTELTGSDEYGGLDESTMITENVVDEKPKKKKKKSE